MFTLDKDHVGSMFTLEILICEKDPFLIHIISDEQSLRALGLIGKKIHTPILLELVLI